MEATARQAARTRPPRLGRNATQTAAAIAALEATDTPTTAPATDTVTATPPSTETVAPPTATATATQTATSAPTTAAPTATFTATPSATATASATATPTESATPTPQPAVAVVEGFGRPIVRSGPGTAFSTAGTVAGGDELPIVARASDTDSAVWYLVQLPDGAEAWIAAFLVRVEPEDAVVPPAEAIPTPRFPETLSYAPEVGACTYDGDDYVCAVNVILRGGVPPYTMTYQGETVWDYSPIPIEVRAPRCETAAYDLSIVDTRGLPEGGPEPAVHD
ncbi:MAG: SH3 domain-containing protein [Anaerolineae bacterium]|nr:SH3 domain-containing protein [Anaerolineae bacterium]